MIRPDKLIGKGLKALLPRVEAVGVCPGCTATVYSDQRRVRYRGDIYHHACAFGRGRGYETK